MDEGAGGAAVVPGVADKPPRPETSQKWGKAVMRIRIRIQRYKIKGKAEFRS